VRRGAGPLHSGFPAVAYKRGQSQHPGDL